MRKLFLPITAILLLTQQATAEDTKPGNEIRQQGQASYFRAGENGNTLTASGEPVAPQEHTAASRDLPLGTVVTVTNQKTGQSTEVRINDRGPTLPDRIIDVSEQAARDLGIEEIGLAPVIVEADPDKQQDPEIRKQLEQMATK